MQIFSRDQAGGGCQKSNIFRRQIGTKINCTFWQDNAGKRPISPGIGFVPSEIHRRNSRRPDEPAHQGGPRRRDHHGGIQFPFEQQVSRGITPVIGQFRILAIQFVRFQKLQGDRARATAVRSEATRLL